MVDTFSVERTHVRSSAPVGPDAGALVARLAVESLAALAASDDEPARIPVLSEAEAEVVAELLDELAARCAGEDLGQLAWTLSARLPERAAERAGR